MARLLLLFSLTTVISTLLAQPDNLCSIRERRCTKPYCFDLTCDGSLIESEKGGLCPCRAGLIREFKKRFGERQCIFPPPSCIAVLTTQPPIPYTYPPPIQNAEPRPVPPQNAPAIPTPAVGYEFAAVQDLKRFPLVYSLYSDGRHDHMYTTDYHEITQANKDSYVTEGAIGRLASNASIIEGNCPFLQPLHRLYEWFWANNHFYTTSEEQAKLAQQSGYTLEGSIGMCVIFAPDCGANVPLHRFWNAKQGDHIYVTKPKDVASLKEDVEWKYEGIECYIWPTANDEAAEMIRLRREYEKQLKGESEVVYFS